MKRGLLLALLIGSVQAAEPLGRLFLSPTQRAEAEQLWRERQQPALRGEIRRNDGRGTRWVDDRQEPLTPSPRPAQAAGKQRGLALLPLLFSLILAASLLLLAQHRSSAQTPQNLDARLAAAKAALIARAVGDANRPGSLPCPDFLTDNAGLSNVPGDGKADVLTRNDCPSYVGWLPWATLGLGRLSDEGGEVLWYALAPELRDDDNAPPLNSDLVSSLRSDGQDDVAAIVFAPGPPLAGQQRPSRRIADYLEGPNADGDLLYGSGPASPTFNDRLLVIRRSELLAAVEQRIANTARRCLDSHAAQTRAYPWPAPLAASGQRGRQGSRFGRLPLSQPGAGPQRELAAEGAALDAALSTLPATLSPDIDSAALRALGERLSTLQIYADQLYAVANAIYGQAAPLYSQSTAFDAQAQAATANGRISVSERTALDGAAQNLLAGIDKLLPLLTDSGLDPFPLEIARQATQLQSLRLSCAAQPDSTTLKALGDALGPLASLLQTADTASPALQTGLAQSRTALGMAAQAIAEAGNGEAARLATALAATAALENTLNALHTQIEGMRPSSYQANNPDNLTLSSLITLRSRLAAEQIRFATAVTRTQAEMVPYAESLRALTVDLQIWPKMLAEHSARIAATARRTTGGKTDDPNALYSQAGNAAQSIVGDSGSLALIAAYLAAPTRSDKRNAAEAALQATRTAVTAARNALQTLATATSAGSAEAFPMVWRHSDCAPLQTTSDGGSWWHTQGWAANTFYQIAGDTPDAPASLRINGRDAYKRVVLNAGRALSGQSRPSQRIEDYLEGANAAPDRAAESGTPNGDFTLGVPSPTFNDRLAY